MNRTGCAQPLVYAPHLGDAPFSPQSCRNTRVHLMVRLRSGEAPCLSGELRREWRIGTTQLPQPVRGRLSSVRVEVYQIPLPRCQSVDTGAKSNPALSPELLTI